jgi:Putative MetA-pathway of phenol degradation
MRRGNFVKVKGLLLAVPFACATTICSFGQIDCTNSTKLICELPITSSNLTPTGGQATAAAQAASTPINASIGTQLTQLPVPSATVGVVSLRDPTNPVGIPYDNLGPILVDRPDTVGKGHLFAGFSYQHFNFNEIDGVPLKSLPVGYTFDQTVSGDAQTIYGTVNNKIAFQLDQYVALATYGVTRTTDVLVVVPFSTVSLDVLASGFQTYLYDTRAGQYINESRPAGTTVATTGSANGVGDVTVSVKQLIHGIEGTRTAVAVGAAVRFPTGDELNYLGSGAYGVNIFGLVSYRARLSPHLKLSNQWNGTSKLVNTTADTHGDKTLPGGLQYDVGADYKIIRPLTVAVDFLGNQFVNTPSLLQQPLTLKPVPTDGITPLSLPTVVQLNNTYTTANISAGLKWSPIPHLLLYGNVLIQLNDVGLKSDPVPLYGISYNFRVKH